MIFEFPSARGVADRSLVTAARKVEREKNRKNTIIVINYLCVGVLRVARQSETVGRRPKKRKSTLDPMSIIHFTPCAFGIFSNLMRRDYRTNRVSAGAVLVQSVPTGRSAVVTV